MNASTTIGKGIVSQVMETLSHLTVQYDCLTLTDLETLVTEGYRSLSAQSLPGSVIKDILTDRISQSIEQSYTKVS